MLTPGNTKSGDGLTVDHCSSFRWALREEDPFWEKSFLAQLNKYSAGKEGQDKEKVWVYFVVFIQLLMGNSKPKEVCWEREVRVLLSLKPCFVVTFSVTVARLRIRRRWGTPLCVSGKGVFREGYMRGKSHLEREWHHPMRWGVDGIKPEEGWLHPFTAS